MVAKLGTQNQDIHTFYVYCEMNEWKYWQQGIKKMKSTTLVTALGYLDQERKKSSQQVSMTMMITILNRYTNMYIYIVFYTVIDIPQSKTVYTKREEFPTSCREITIICLSATTISQILS